MKLSLSYKNIDSPKPVELVVNRHVRKLEALLKNYAPDLVQLRGHFTKQLRRIQFSCSVNLSLPTGTLHAVAEGPDPKVCAREAFAELEAQVKKHKALLRKDFEWKRKRGRAEKALAT